MSGLRAEGLTVTLDRRVVLDGVDLDVAPGEVVCVRAPSGAGKSTLLRALVRLVALDGGTVTLAGTDVLELAAPELRRRVGLVSQTPFMLAGTVADNLRYGVPPLTDAAVLQTLDAAGLDASFADRAATQLSGGERARVAVARALTREPAFVLLDEPTAALDQTATERTGALVRDLARRGLGVCLTTHDAAFAARHADREVHL
jgi:ABC-type cobalamin/Fe3+-siderophores transport system ATPase subunit